MATIRDIAKAAGVSPATVSRVLNYDLSLSVSQGTKEKIFAVAEELNYQKHKKRNKQGAYTLRLLQWYDEQEELADLYYYGIRHGVEKKAAELKVTLLRETPEKLSQIKTDGTIALGKFDDRQIQQLADLGRPLLFVDYDASKKGFDSLLVDFDQSVDQVLDYFIAAGHEKIAILYGEEKTKGQQQSIVDPRFLAFRKKMQRLNLFDPQLAFSGDFSVAAGKVAMQKFLQKNTDRPTSLFATSDALAIGAMQACKEADIKIPEELAVIGFNDVSVAKYVSPTLSTIKVETEWMGELAVLKMLEQLKENPPVAQKILLNTKLVLRESAKLE